MSDPNAPGIEKNLYIHQRSHVVRTGLLKYYDPLRFSDLANMTLAELSVVNHTLPDPIDPETLPVGINAVTFTLTVDTGS